MGLARGLQATGHACKALASPISNVAIDHLAKLSDADVVVRINAFAPLRNSPKSWRHVSWIQDPLFFGSTAAELQEQQDDVVLFMGDSLKLQAQYLDFPCQVGLLFSGIAPEAFCEGDTGASSSDGVVSLVGYLPPALDLSLIHGRREWGLQKLAPASLDNLRELVFTLNQVIEISYDPCTGSLDENLLLDDLLAAYSGWATAYNFTSSLLERWLDRRWSQVFSFPAQKQVMAPSGPSLGIRSWLSWGAIHVPRRLDRLTLARALDGAGVKTALYGGGWGSEPEFESLWHGAVSTQSELLNIYATSGLSILNNTHGLGAHSRTFECASVGAFMMSHASAFPQRAGSLESVLVPGREISFYDVSQVGRDASTALKDRELRLAIGSAARERVLAEHTWTRRARELLETLK